jgi:hypothetical protein
MTTFSQARRAEETRIVKVYGWQFNPDYALVSLDDAVLTHMAVARGPRAEEALHFTIGADLDADFRLVRWLVDSTSFLRRVRCRSRLPRSANSEVDFLP